MTQQLSPAQISKLDYETKVYSNEQALELMQTLASRLLGQVVKGEIDFNALARQILTNRGQDVEGKWVGFKEAAELHSN